MNILLATDGSADSQAVVDVLLASPPRPDDALLVLSVTPILSKVDRETGEPEAWTELDNVAQELVDDEVTRLTDAGHVAFPLLADGDPATEILRMADEYAVDVIFLGAQGAGGIRRFRLGSVAQRVAHHATCSVLVVRPPARPFTSLLVATDGSEAANDAVDSLAAVPRSESAIARVLNVLPSPEAEIVARDPAVHARLRAIADQLRDEYRSVAESVCAEVVEHLAVEGITAYPSIVTGHPVEAIVNEATVGGTDLIVLGAQSRPDLTRSLLGSVAVGVLRDASCSVLIGRRPGAE